MNDAAKLMLMGAGSVPTLLFNTGFDVRKYRQRLMESNATVLRDDEYKLIQDEVVDAARSRLTIVSDCVANNCVYPITNGLGKTVLEYEKASDMNDAQIHMLAEAAGDGDRILFDQAYLPLPIIFKDYQINARNLASSRERGMPLDTHQARIAGLKVAEKIESLFATGSSSFTAGGGTIYGLLDFPSANAYDITTNWDDSGADPVANVIAMKAAAQTDKHYGPYMLYIPQNWSHVLDDDFKAASDKSLYQRLKEIPGILDVKVSDFLTADYCVLVEMQPQTIQAVIGLQPVTLEWDTHGGMVSNYKVISIIIPLLRADYDGNCGIVIGST